MTPMKIKALAPWFGSKRSLAPTIVELIGKHKAYWEPFCGSMAVLMRKPTCDLETMNDLNGDLINLAKVVQDRDLAFEFYDKLSRTLCSERFFLEAKERWTSAPTEALLADVMIVQKDAFYLLENIKDEAGTVIYCDPPYFTKSNKYVYDFENEDHTRLAELLNRFKHTRVIVSYYDDPKLEQLYAGWDRPHTPKNMPSMRNATKANKSPAPAKSKTQTEVLLVNHKVQTGLF